MDIRTLIALVAAAGLFSAPTHAEIEKNARRCDHTLCFYWWPKLPPLKGWHQDRPSSFHDSINALAPDGQTFANAEAVIYARAIFKPRAPDVKSLDQLIENDKADFLVRSRDISIEPASSPVTGDGQSLRSLSFIPGGSGNWERVSYGEEGNYYLLFTLSSRSERAFKDAMSAYETLIATYKENN
jgi:hypothetical protein